MPCPLEDSVGAQVCDFRGKWGPQQCFHEGGWEGATFWGTLVSLGGQPQSHFCLYL